MLGAPCSSLFVHFLNQGFFCQSLCIFSAFLKMCTVLSLAIYILFFFFLFLNVTQCLLHILISCSKPYLKSISSSVTFSILPSIPFHISLHCSSFFRSAPNGFHIFCFISHSPSFTLFTWEINLSLETFYTQIVFFSNSNNSVLDRHGTSSFSK